MRPGRRSHAPRRRRPRAGRRSPASSISSTFSAFFSPLRERLNDPTNDRVVADGHLRVHEVVHRPPPNGVDSLPVNGPASTCCSSGSFHETLPFARHWRITSRICVASTQPAMSTDRSAITCASVPSTGPVVITGEQIRTRLRARPDQLGDAHRQILAVPRREPGAHAVVPARVDEAAAHRRRPSTRAARSRARTPSRSPRRRRPRPRSPAATTSRRSSSASPVHTVAPSRIDVLVVHQVGDAGDRLAFDRQRRDQQRVGLAAAAAPESGSRGRRCRRTGCRRPASAARRDRVADDRARSRRRG